MTYLLPGFPISLPLLPVARLGGYRRDGVTDFLNGLTEQYEKASLMVLSKPNGRRILPR